MSLFIIIVLSTMTLSCIHYQKTTTINEVEIMLTDFLQEAKSYATLSHQQVDVDFYQHYVTYSDQDNTYRYTLPEPYYFDHIQEVYFNKNGNINQANHIDIVSDQQTYQLVFHLGAGDFDVQ